ncbi:MAG: hypothetical protein WD266_08500 [Balneolales bacterium]
MKPALVLISAILLWSCSTFERVNTAQPEFVEVSALPFPESKPTDVELKLNVQFYVLNDGSIEEVRILPYEGQDQDWDTLAITRMKRWRFSELGDEHADGGLWVRRAIVIKPEEEIILTLGQLRALNREEADSLHALLGGGTPFHDLANEHSPEDSGESEWFLGHVSVSKYPEYIRDELRKLRVNSYTRPLRYRGQHVIFKRFKQDIRFDEEQLTTTR